MYLLKNNFLMFIPFLLLILLSCQKMTNAVRPFLISEEEEIIMGNKFKAQILADTDTYPLYEGDSRVKRFIDSLGFKIVGAQDERKTLPFTFTIIDSDNEVNAFAIPGGHVFVYTGLLKGAKNCAEVAGVLAHEVGHIVRYHSVNKFIQTTSVSYVNSILSGSDSSSTAAIAGLLENMLFLNYSRDNEFEADSCAVVYTSRAKINPFGMKYFLSYLKEEYGDTPTIFEPFSSHPPLSDRIKKVQVNINKVAVDPSDSTSNLFEDEYKVIKNLL